MYHINKQKETAHVHMVISLDAGKGIDKICKKPITNLKTNIKTLKIISQNKEKDKAVYSPYFFNRVVEVG